MDITFFRSKSAAAVVLAFVVATAGCSSDRSAGQQDGAAAADHGVNDASTRADAAVRADAMGGRDGGATKDAGASKPCPATLPTSGSSCSRDGLVCQYGSDPRRDCRPYARCSSGRWSVTSPKCAPLPPASCPKTRQDAAGKTCSVKDAYCSYTGDVICRCTNCRAYPIPVCSGPLTWHCDVPPADKQCPAGKPNLGTSCSTAGKRCVYSCGADGARICQGGVWVSATGNPCPISTRRVKREIAYLTPAQRTAIARRALHIKLATYRYTDPALGRGPQLGFIIEDLAADSFAADPSRIRVNLYGYTSMLLATVQAQQRQLVVLRRQLRDVRSRLTQLESPSASRRIRHAPAR